MQLHAHAFAQDMSIHELGGKPAGSSELQEWQLDFSNISGASSEQLAPCQRMVMQALRGLMQQPGGLR